MSTEPTSEQKKEYHLDEEPVVRIGVVLIEDQKTEMEVTVPKGGYEICVDDKCEAVVGYADCPLNIFASLDGVTIADKSGQRLVTDAQAPQIVPPKGEIPEKAGDGALVRGVVAGRGFHWQKEIDQTLSDVLEFTSHDGFLVMVNALPLETYLVGVITGEMSGECPIEFLKAQGTAARSWLLGQKKSPHPGEPFFWCNDDCCQRYQGTGGWSERAKEAIRQCRGMVLITESDEYCDTRYSKSTGGISEDASHIWWNEELEGLEAKPDAPKGSEVERFFPVTEDNVREYLTGDWLKNTDCYASPNVVPEDTITKYLGRVDEPGTYFRWRKTVTQESLQESLTKRGGIEDLDKVLDLVPGKRGRSGRLSTLHVEYLDKEGNRRTRTIETEYNIRAAVDVKFLYSGCFIPDVEKDADGVLVMAELIGGGWGHGAGLCQIGALGRALKDQGYDEILLHYYSKVNLEQIYP